MSETFSENRGLYETMKENIVVPARRQITIKEGQKL